MRLLFELISSFDARIPNFRPIEIYNESWLIKLIMWLASTICDYDFPLGFHPESTWFLKRSCPQHLNHYTGVIFWPKLEQTRMETLVTF